MESLFAALLTHLTLLENTEQFLPLDLLIVDSPQFTPLARKKEKKTKPNPRSYQEVEKKQKREGESVFFFSKKILPRHVTDPVIMRIHLIVRINRRANDTLNSPFAFRQRERGRGGKGEGEREREREREREELEGRGELSPSVNMCDINMYMSNWSRLHYFKH